MQLFHVVESWCDDIDTGCRDRYVRAAMGALVEHILGVHGRHGQHIRILVIDEVEGRAGQPHGDVIRAQQKREDNAFRKGILTGAAGGAMFGPPGAIVGALIGAISGYDENPDW